MWYSYRFRAYPDKDISVEIERQIDIHRQGYNQVLHEYNNLDDERVGTAYGHQKLIKKWKSDWSVFSEVHSRALQNTVKRLYHNLDRLDGSDNQLKWKAPAEFRSIKYSQSGFELKNTSGQTAELWLSKIGDIKIRYHRKITEDIKEVTIRREKNGNWYVTFGVEIDTPNKKTDIKDISRSDCIAISLGSYNYVNLSNGTSVDWLNLEKENSQVRKERNNLYLKENGSNNWLRQRRNLHDCYNTIQLKTKDFQHKITSDIIKNNEIVFVEENSSTCTNTEPQNICWHRFVKMLEYKGELYGTRVVTVERDEVHDNIKCGACNIASKKELFSAHKSCPSCDSDKRIDLSHHIYTLGMSKVGMGDSEFTPAETGASVDLPARSVVDSGSVN